MGQLDLGFFFEGLRALAIGSGLGLLYYGGLWWTVRRLPRTAHPGPLFMASFVLRIVAVLAGLFALTGGAWFPLALAMLGFLIVRFILVRRWGPGAVEPGAQTLTRRNHDAQS